MSIIKITMQVGEERSARSILSCPVFFFPALSRFGFGYLLERFFEQCSGVVGLVLLGDFYKSSILSRIVRCHSLFSTHDCLALLVSPFISEALANYTTKELLSSACVVNTFRNPIAISKIKLRKITVHVLLRAMLINALHATFEDGKISLDGVGVNFGIVQGDILPFAVTHRAVQIKIKPQELILSSIIGHNSRFPGNVFSQDRNNGFGSNIIYRNTTNLTRFTVYKGKNLVFVSSSALYWLFRIIPEESFIGFNSPAIPTKRCKHAFPHCFTDSMAHEPCALESNPQNPMELIRADAFLGGANLMHCLEPKSERNMAVFEDRSDLNSELFPACIALVEADAIAFAIQFADLFFASAVRTNGAFRPKPRFNKSIRSFFILEVRGRKHWLVHSLISFVKASIHTILVL